MEMRLFGVFCVGLLMIGASANALTAIDWEFVSCPVTESIPGFKYKNISALGVAALVNASEDIGMFLDNGCDPNFSGTYLTYIDTKCANPVFDRLGIPCARQLKVEGLSPLLLAVLHGTTETVKKLVQIPQIDLDAEVDSFSPLWLAAHLGNLEMVIVLAEAGARLEIRGGEYLITLLKNAAAGNKGGAARYLIRKKLHREVLSGQNGAYFAAVFGYLTSLQDLEKAATNLDILYGEKQFSTLSDDLLADIIYVTLLLIKNGVNDDTQLSTPPPIADKEKHLPTLKALAEAGANLETIEGSFERASLILATMKGQLKTARRGKLISLERWAMPVL